MNNLLSLFTGKSAPPWTPSAKSGLVVWFRADSVVLSGNNVLSWTDKSGNGRNASGAGTGSAQWVASDINGQPAVSFPGGATPPYYTFGGTTTLFPLGSPGAVVVVTKSAGVPANGFGVMFALISGGGSGQFVTAFTSNAANYGLYTLAGGVTTGGTNINNSFDPGAAWSALVNNYNGAGDFNQTANWAVYANNSLQTMSHGTGTVNTGGNTASLIGAYNPPVTTLPYAGDIAEILVWNSQLNSTDLTNLHTYLNTRYGVGVG